MVTSILSLALIGSAIAGDNSDFFEKVRAVLPPGWDVAQKVGTSDFTITRNALVPPSDLADNPRPPPSLPEGIDARTKGIRVWFIIEPIGVCTDADYVRRRSQNSEIRAQMDTLRKKIEQIPPTPHIGPRKPSSLDLLLRTPRNQEEQSWLTAYEALRKQLQLVPTHHYSNKGFFIFLLRSYDGVIIKTLSILDEIDGVRKAVETVLVPYESQGSP
jgi:hypothetical protein